MSTRRSFLSVSAAALAAASFPKYLFAQTRGIQIFTNASSGAYTQGLMTQVHFKQLIGSIFTAFHATGETSSLKLVQVSDAVVQSSAVAPTVSAAIGRLGGLARPVSRPVTTISYFSASFAVTGKALPQDSYLLDHGTLGSFAAFLVPGLSPNGAASCSATFNYLAQGSVPLSVQQIAPPAMTVRGH